MRLIRLMYRVFLDILINGSIGFIDSISKQG